MNRKSIGYYSRVRWLLLMASWIAMLPVQLLAESGTCSYETYKWNALKMKSGPAQRVVKPYGMMTAEERDAGTGCSVCREDQVEIRLQGINPFQVCRKLAPMVEQTLRKLQVQGVPIHKVVGYRVGMTRGEPDVHGNRTRFSNHSFGIALDINEGQNGLYESCTKIGPGCRLRKGGKWEPGISPASMTPNHPVVLAMKRAGFRWGGEIAGDQKDFMHFSPSGY